MGLYFLPNHIATLTLDLIKSTSVSRKFWVL